MSLAIRVPIAEDLPPAPILVEAMAAHLDYEHNHELALERDISFPGNPVWEPIVFWRNAAGGSFAAFWCRLCPDEEGYIPPSRRKPLADRGRLHLLDGFPPNDSDRIPFIKRHSPGLRPFLDAAPPARHDELVAAYDRGELGPALLHAVDAIRPRQSEHVHGDDLLRRVKGFCAWFLSVYGEEGSVERAIERFIRLHETDRDAYRAVLGTDRRYADETFREYVYMGTSEAEREKAKRAGKKPAGAV